MAGSTAGNDLNILTMRNICYIITLTVCFALAACSGMDDIPTDSYLEKKFWTSIEKAQYVLNMAYNQLYSARQMYSDEKLGDNLVQGRRFTDERTIRNGNSEPTTGIFDYEWRDMYAGIKTCNVFLNNIVLIKADARLKARMKAQARYIRAAMFFRLTTFYGAVPYFCEEPTEEMARKIKRTPHEAVMDSLHKELDAILDLLPSKDELRDSERGEVTKGAVLTLQARAYLYDSDWENVERYCAMLMDQQDRFGHYRLFDSYSGLFLQENEYNDEVIFDYGYAPRVRTWGEMYDLAPLSVGARVNDSAPTQSLVDNYVMLDGKPIDESDLYDEQRPYDNRDPRLTHTVVYDHYEWSKNVNDGTKGKIIYIHPDARDKTDAYAGHNKNQTITGYYVRKYYDPNHEDHLFSSINIITMRYADVLLMYAEAMNEQGKMDKNVWDRTVRAIRQRAGFTMQSALDYPVGMRQEQMRELLRRERRSELALEGLRWYDIKRWRTGMQHLDGYVFGAKFENKCTENIRLDLYKFNESKDYLWAVPQSQIDINGNLKPQNPGY